MFIINVCSKKKSCSLLSGILLETENRQQYSTSSFFKQPQKETLTLLHDDTIGCLFSRPSPDSWGRQWESLVNRPKHKGKILIRAQQLWYANNLTGYTCCMSKWIWKPRRQPKGDPRGGEWKLIQLPWVLYFTNPKLGVELLPQNMCKITPHLVPQLAPGQTLQRWHQHLSFQMLHILSWAAQPLP